MEKGTVKRRIFLSNALMVLVTLLIFLAINLAVVKIYAESVEKELKTSIEDLIDGSGTSNFSDSDNVKYQHKDAGNFSEIWMIFWKAGQSTEMSLSFYLEQMELSVSLYFY